MTGVQTCALPIFPRVREGLGTLHGAPPKCKQKGQHVENSQKHAPHHCLPAKFHTLPASGLRLLAANGNWRCVGGGLGVPSIKLADVSAPAALGA